MFRKYGLAFALGALSAGVVAYFVAVRRPAPVPPPPPTQIQSTQPEPAPAPPAATTSDQPQPAPQPVSVKPEPVRTTSRTKPEPPRPAPVAPVSTEQTPEQPVAVAQAQEPTVILPQPSPVTPQLPPPPEQTEPQPQSQHSNILKPDPETDYKPRTPQTVTLPAGTPVAVRLSQAVSTDKQSEGDAFTATMDQPIVIDGFVIADRGSLVRGKVASLTPATRGKSHASLVLELTEINTTDDQRVDIHTDQSLHEATSHPKKDVAKVVAIAALGAIIGAAAGGGAGAGIGAAAGAGAGGGAVLIGKGEQVRLPAETRLDFKLAEPVTLTEKLK